MLMCYVAYPVIKSILGSLKKYVPLVIVIVLYTLLVYNNIVIPKYALDSTYSNPIIRTAEFMIGVAFAEIVFRERKNADRAFMKNLGAGGWKPLWVILFLVVISASIAVIAKVDIIVLVFGYMVIPGILSVLSAASCVRGKRIENSKLLSVLSGMSYQFFLAQLFLWKITGGLLEVLGISGNMVKISVSLICCIFISFIVWYFYDRPVRKILYKKMIEVIKDI